jgi:hypothetical protein
MVFFLKKNLIETYFHDKTYDQLSSQNREGRAEGTTNPSLKVTRAGSF